MRKLGRKTLIFCALGVSLSSYSVAAQETERSLTEDEKIEQLLEIKTQMGKTGEIGDRFKIQLFNGDNGQASEVIKNYRSKFEWPSDIVYEAPNYKVWIGNFRNRLEAERALVSIKNEFPSAFIPKPRRR